MHKQRKGLLSIQFILGIGVFLSSLIVSITFLIMYSIGYFSALQQQEKYDELKEAGIIFYDTMQISDNKINTTFAQLIENCISTPYYDPQTSTFSSSYLELQNILKIKSFPRFAITHTQYINLAYKKQVNATHNYGKFDTSEYYIFKEPGYAIYNALHWKPTNQILTPQSPETITINEVTYTLDYLESLNGKYAILKSETQTCGPGVPKINNVKSIKIYVVDNNITHQYEIFTW